MRIYNQIRYRQYQWYAKEQLHFSQTVVQVVRKFADLIFHKCADSPGAVALFEKILRDVQCGENSNSQRRLLGNPRMDRIDHLIDVGGHSLRELLALTPQRVLRTKYPDLDALSVRAHLAPLLKDSGNSPSDRQALNGLFDLQIRLEFRKKYLDSGRKRCALSVREGRHPLCGRFLKGSCYRFQELLSLHELLL